MSGTLPELSKPPLNEVVYGLRFVPLPLFKSAHFGLFWAQVRDHYPRTEDVEPLFDPIEIGKVHLEPIGQRVWLMSETGNRLLQMQRGRFYMNWRQIQPDDEYPRFSKLYPDFVKTAGEFRDFVKEHGLGAFVPKQLELTYINHIYEGGGWRLPGDAGEIIGPLRWKRDDVRRLGAAVDLGWRTNFSQRDGEVQLAASIQSAKRKTDEVPLLLFELRAHKVLANEPELEEVLDWYPKAREEIVRAFFEITTEKAQEKLWTRPIQP